MKCLLSCTLAKSRVHCIAFRSQVIYRTCAHHLQNSLVREFTWKLRDLLRLGQQKVKRGLRFSSLECPKL